VEATHYALLELERSALLVARNDAAHAVDVAADQVAAQRVAHAQRALQVHARAHGQRAQRRPRQRLGAKVGGEAPG